MNTNSLWPKAPAAENAQSLRILIVEDNDNTRKLLRVALETPGRQIAEARTAKDASACLNDHEVDLLILDVGLPGSADGLSFARGLRRQAQYKHLRIIIVTGHSDLLTTERAKVLGVDGFLQKPFQIAKLAELVTSVESQLLAEDRPHPPHTDNPELPVWLHKPAEGVGSKLNE